MAVLPCEQDPDLRTVLFHWQHSTGDGSTGAHALPLDAFVLNQLTTHASKAQAGRAALTLAEQLTHPVSQLTFLQQAESRLQLPAGSHSEALGIGDATRPDLEEVLSQLVLTTGGARSCVA